MKEIQQILRHYDDKRSSGISMALATVVNIHGSSYRRPGARMLIFENGNWTGGISGGCLEGDILKHALKAIYEGKPSIRRYDTTQTDNYEVGVGLGCQGIIDILIAPLKASEAETHFEYLRQVIKKRSPCTLVQVCLNNSKIPLNEGLIVGEERVGEDILKFLGKSEGALFEKFMRAAEMESRSIYFNFYASHGKDLHIFIEKFKPVVHLYVFGDNYDVHPIVDICSTLGWKTSLIGNRYKIFKRVLSTADNIVHSKDPYPDLEIDAYSAVILMAHDYKTDLRNLRLMSGTDTFYIGLLGPRDRGERLMSDLKKSMGTLDDALLQKVYMPTGLDIGANTPEEIAISVVAEVNTVLRKRNGSFLRERSTPIHPRT